MPHRSTRLYSFIDEVLSDGPNFSTHQGMTKGRGSTVHPEVADHAVSDLAKEDTILPCQSLTDISSEATIYPTIESCCTHLGNSPEHPLNGCPLLHD